MAIYVCMFLYVHTYMQVLTLAWIHIFYIFYFDNISTSIKEYVEKHKENEVIIGFFEGCNIFNIFIKQYLVLVI